MDYGDRITGIHEGGFVIVPEGTKHRTFADIETYLLLFETGSTLNSGIVRNELTHDSPQKI